MYKKKNIVKKVGTSEGKQLFAMLFFYTSPCGTCKCLPPSHFFSQRTFCTYRKLNKYGVPPPTLKNFSENIEINIVVELWVLRTPHPPPPIPSTHTKISIYRIGDLIGDFFSACQNVKIFRMSLPPSPNFKTIRREQGRIYILV